MTMQSMTEILDRMADTRHQTLTDDDKAEIEDVLDAAQDYAGGRLPANAFAAIGGMLGPRNGRPCPEYTRFVALQSTPLNDPRRADLLRAIDDVLRLQGLVILSSTAGVWSHEDLAGMTIRTARDPWQADDRGAA